MCGIVGLLAPRAPEPEAIARRMAATIVHRGPDDDGFFAHESFAMGMRRLSIIDLSGGHQPISNETGDLTIVFNGEIYNYRELRTTLLELGHQFRTHSDTEVILHAYEQFGADCVHRFNGMFAFAIWDRRRRELFIARDRMGVKPLYYASTGENFVFGSEIKAVLASNLVPKALNDTALWHYLTFRYVPESVCIWSNISKLPPAHHLTLRLDDMLPRVQRYWDIPYDRPVEDLSPQDEASTFEALFEDAVRLRLIADVPVGILLSGGLDSSTVAAAVRRVHSAPVKTFSVAFRDGGDADESPYARLVAERLGTSHYEIRIGQEEFEEWMPSFVWSSDEPLADSASVPLFFVSRLAAEHVKVVLSGEGSDELLAGYHFERILTDVARVERQARVGSRALGMLPPSARGAVRRALRGRRLGRLFLDSPEVMQWMAPNMTSEFSSEEKQRLWPAAPDFEDSNEVVRRVYARAPTRDPLNSLLYVYSQDWLVEDLLMKADKMTMATSIELRVPFLDYRLVEWLASRPASSKLRMGADGSVTRKVLLREYAARHLPREIIERPKVGFATPVLSWVREDRGGMVSAVLRGANSWVRSKFDGRVLDGLMSRANSDSRATVQLWHLYVLEHWARRWL